jgi:hypothetical protein
VIFTDGARTQGETYLEDAPTSLGEAIGNTAAAAWHDLPIRSLVGMKELNEASSGEETLGSQIQRLQGGEDLADVVSKPRPVPEVPLDQARARVKEAGLDQTLKLPEQSAFKAPALEIMMDRARDRREREAAIARGPGGFIPGALTTGTSFLVGAVDPLNVASAFIPVLGEMRYAKLMADAGSSAFARAGVRAAVGGASGAVGSAPIIGLEALAKTQEGQDFTMADALRQLMFGTVLGGGLHSGGGAVADILRARSGKPLFPRAPGEPFDASRESGNAQGSPLIAQTPAEVQARVPAPENAQAPAAASREAETDAAIAEIKWDRATTGEGKTPVGSERDQTVIDIDPRALDRAFKATSRSFYDLPGDAMERLKAHVAAGGEVSIPEIALTEGKKPGRIDFINGRHRARLAADMGLESIPVAVDRGQEAALRKLLSQHEPEQTVPSPIVQALDDLPPRAKEDALRAAISDLHEGRPVSSGDVVVAAAKTDPRIAESIEAWHGSPHDFDRFDVSRIGTGEGAQSYGHGLYFAEEKQVATSATSSCSTTTHVEITHKNGEPVSRGERAGDPAREAEQPGRRRRHAGPARRTRSARAGSRDLVAGNEFLASRGGIDPTDPLIGDVRGSIGTSNKFVPGLRAPDPQGRHAARPGARGGGRGRLSARQRRRHRARVDDRRRTLLDAIDRELRGERVYREGREPVKGFDPSSTASTSSARRTAR